MNYVVRFTGLLALAMGGLTGYAFYRATRTVTTVADQLAQLDLMSGACVCAMGFVALAVVWVILAILGHLFQ